MTLNFKKLICQFAFGATIAYALFGLSSVQAADVAAGEKLFGRCTACHAVGPGAVNKIGPQLNGVVGRQAGIVVGYDYGTGIIAARGAIGEDVDGNGYLDVPEGYSGLVWTEENLVAYILNPKKFLVDYTKDPKAKAKMAFNMKKDEDRANVIAYLKTIGLDGNAAPAQ